MHTPFDNPAPETFEERITHYARDIAWGVINELWSTTLYTYYIEHTQFVFPYIIEGAVKPSKLLEDLYADKINESHKKFLHKWVSTERMPKLENVEYFGYASYLNNDLGDGKLHYQLSHSAFDLLRQPYRSPRIFISYRRYASSALSPALEARLRLLGNNDVFVDKSITPGDNWDDVLKEKIINCDYFILLVDKEVFESQYVKQEFDLAVVNNKKIIPIALNDVRIDSFNELNHLHAVHCEGKASARTIEDGINAVLAAMGYPTY